MSHGKSQFERKYGCHAVHALYNRGEKGAHPSEVWVFLKDFLVIGDANGTVKETFALESLESALYSLCQQGGRINQHGNIAGAVKTYVPSCRVERKLQF